MSRRHLPLALSLLVALSVVPLVAAEPSGRAEVSERTVLEERSYDLVVLVDGRSLRGQIEQRLADGALRLAESAGTGTSRSVFIPAEQIRRIQPRATLAEAIARRGDEALAAHDWKDLATVFAAADRAEARRDPLAIRASVITLAVQGMEATGPVSLGERALELCWREPADPEGAERLVVAGLAQDRLWEGGLAARVKIAEVRKDPVAREIALRTWVERRPSSLAGNRLWAVQAEADGDLKVAAEAWRKCFDLNQDLDAGLELARISLRRGEPDEALRAVAPALKDPQRGPYALAWQGAAWLAQGEGRTAKVAASPAPTGKGKAKASEGPQGALEQALVGGVHGEAEAYARYNLGLVHWRAGRRDDALIHWRNAQLPLADLALAMAEGRSWTPPAGSPARLIELADLHRARLALLAGNAATADQALAGRIRGRAGELATCAAILNTRGDPAAIKPLALRTDAEALRWAAYGHLLGGRVAEARRLLDQLPDNDGWGLACRIHLAIQAGDEATATTLAARLPMAPDAPQDYAHLIQAELTAAATAEMEEDFFAWGDGGAVLAGWTLANERTGLVLQRRDSRLFLRGTQIEDSPTRLTRRVAGQRLREVDLTFRISGTDPGIRAGITVVPLPRSPLAATAAPGARELGQVPAEVLARLQAAATAKPAVVEDSTAEPRPRPAAKSPAPAAVPAAQVPAAAPGIASGPAIDLVVGLDGTVSYRTTAVVAVPPDEDGPEPGPWTATGLKVPSVTDPVTLRLLARPEGWTVAVGDGGMVVLPVAVDGGDLQVGAIGLAGGGATWELQLTHLVLELGPGR